MKVLFTVSTYFPQKDGVQNVTGYLAEGLARRGHDVTVITSHFDLNVPEEEIYNNVKIKRIKLYTKYGLYLGDKRNYIKLIDEYASNVDVMINVCTQNAFTDLILKRIKNYKCKKILYKHDIFDFRFSKINFSSFDSTINKLWKQVRWYIYYICNKKNFLDYDYVTELHEKCYGYKFFMKKFGIESKIIENAADEDFFVQKHNPKFEKPFEKYIINVSNYDDRKNQKLAVKIFLESNISKEIGMVFIGSKKNKYYNKMEKYILNIRSKYNLKENEKPIKMLYGVDRALVSSFVSNSMLYFMTSKWEAYPISLTESMACGIPFITTNVGISRFLLGGVTAYDIGDLKYYLEKLCNNEELRIELGKLGKIYAEKNLKINDKVKMLEKMMNE